MITDKDMIDDDYQIICFETLQPNIALCPWWHRILSLSQALVAITTNLQTDNAGAMVDRLSESVR